MSLQQPFLRLALLGEQGFALLLEVSDRARRRRDLLLALGQGLHPLRGLFLGGLACAGRLECLRPQGLKRGSLSRQRLAGVFGFREGGFRGRGLLGSLVAHRLKFALLGGEFLPLGLDLAVDLGGTGRLLLPECKGAFPGRGGFFEPIALGGESLLLG